MMLESALPSLRESLRGPLLLPGDAAYEEARSVWNAMIDRRPAAIARCLGTTDVITCVRFARAQGIPLSVKGGGHNIAGLAVSDGGLMIDMSLMRGVWMDAARRIARAQPGCLLSDVDRETQLHGLAAVLGFVSTTGIAGLTLGGGFGYLTRKYGWTCDNVADLDVVTADGNLVRASESENADLFWGLRGGGGNFGIVTGFSYRLFETGPEIVGGIIAWSAEVAQEGLAMYRGLIGQAPPELTCAALIRPAPPAPWLPSAIHGKLIFAIVACHTGPREQAERDLAALKAFGEPVGDTIQPRPFVMQQSLLDATQPKGRRYYWKSDYLSEISEVACERAIAHARHIVPPHSAVIFFPIDGALNALPADFSAVGNRDARYVLNITASWETRGEDAANIAWAREAWQDMRRFSTGGTYINFQTEDEGFDRVEAAYGPNYARLREIKKRWDPENLFRMNKNIPPGG